MIRLALAADRLATGSVRLARRLASRAAAWCARGRRDDLPGWRGALGCWARLAVLVLGLYVLARIVRALPALMWAISGGWTLAAWRAGKPAAKEQKGSPADAPQAPAGDAIRGLLLTLMGEASGVHLRTVLAHLQEHGHWEGKTVADLRQHLEALRIPVRPKVKVGGTPTRGVLKADLDALPPIEETAPSPTPSPAV